MSITIKENVVVKTKDLVIKTPFYYKQDLLDEGHLYRRFCGRKLPDFSPAR